MGASVDNIGPKRFLVVDDLLPADDFLYINCEVSSGIRVPQTQFLQ